jgi:hypothetical protein
VFKINLGLTSLLRRVLNNEGPGISQWETKSESVSS